IARSPIPVFTGIGHERDNTILDEIAYSRFDTPSKVALHIKSAIVDNALGAWEAWKRINVLVGRILHREGTILELQQGRLIDASRSLLSVSEVSLNHIKGQLQRDSERIVREASGDLDTSLAAIGTSAIAITAAARKDIDSFARIVVGLGPQATLQRGFAMVRDENNKPLPSRAAAMGHESLQIEFRDGRIAVKNRDQSGDEEP